MRLILLILFILPNIALALPWKASLNAEIELETFHPLNEIYPDTKQYRGIGTLKLPGSFKYGKNFRVKGLPFIQWDPENVSKSEQFYWDMQEAYLQYQNLPLTVQLGNNVLQWGDTDVFNPIDVVNPRRYFDPFRTEKIGSPMLLVKKDFENFFVEGVYIPMQRETLLPGENSRWLPRDFYRDQSLVAAYGTARIILPASMQYHFVETVKLDHPLNHNIGMRVKFRLPSFDWTLAGFQGAATAPSVGLTRVSGALTTIDQQNNEATLTIDPSLDLRKVFYKVRMGGTSFAWVLDSFLVKGSSAYTIPISNVGVYHPSLLPPKLWENVLGVEKSLSLFGLDFTALVQGTYVSRSDSSDTKSISLSRMFDKAAMAGFRFLPSEKMVILASYLRDIKFKGDLIHAEAMYRFGEHWKLKLNGDFLSGEKETPIGTYSRNDRVSIAINSLW